VSGQAGGPGAEAAARGRTVWTIGTGHRSLDELLDLLAGSGVVRLIDVRSYPRGHLEHFSRASLEQSLPVHGLEYRWLGDDLGGLRHCGYIEHMASQRFATGLQRLEREAGVERSALCCAELDPGRCHRSHIADALCGRGWVVLHILGPGSVVRHEARPQQQRLPFG
jgi:uncharacterized protein (DUF488 family)